MELGWKNGAIRTREPFYSEQEGCHSVLQDKEQYRLIRVISAAYRDERELSVDITAAIGSWNLYLETFPHGVN